MERYESIIVTGDSHGNFAGQEEMFRKAGLIDADGYLCIPEGTALCTMGDDGASKFPYAKKVRHLLQAVNPSKPTRREGPRFHLAGNHDVMELLLIANHFPGNLLRGTHRFAEMRFLKYLGYAQYLPEDWAGPCNTPKPGDAWTTNQEGDLLTVLSEFMSDDARRRSILENISTEDRVALTRYDVAKLLDWNGTRVVLTHTPLRSREEEVPGESCMVNDVLSEESVDALNQRFREMVRGILAGSPKAAVDLETFSMIYMFPGVDKTLIPERLWSKIQASGVTHSIHGHKDRKIFNRHPLRDWFHVFSSDKGAYEDRFHPMDCKNGPSLLYLGRDGQVHEGADVLEKVAARV